MATYLEIKAEELNVSVESLMDGLAGREIEYTLYVRLKDLEELKKRAFRVETHEQWSIPTAKAGCNTRERIRLIDNINPTQCVKTYEEGKLGCEEVEDTITMDMFRAKRRMAVDGYNKTRYSLVSGLRGIIWEVDVFLTNGGFPSPWVKVDLEVKNPNDPIPKFPLEIERVIYGDEVLSYTDKAQVKKLWEEEWQKIDVKKM